MVLDLRDVLAVPGVLDVPVELDEDDVDTSMGEQGSDCNNLMERNEGVLPN